MSDLYPYQIAGAEYLASRKRAYLSDFCGGGKTVQACHAAKLAGVRSALVIAPASTLENWRREWAKWGPAGDPVDVLSYASPVLQADLRPRHDLVILDEAHYCKNRRAKRTLAALDIARRAHRAWLLSGTPLPNDPGELWAPIRALWPEIPQELGLDSYAAWFDHFCHWHLTKYGKKAHGIRNPQQLAGVIRRIMLRRTLSEVGLQLPPLRVDVSLLPRDAAFAEALEALQIDAGALEGRMAAEDRQECSQCHGEASKKKDCEACGGKGYTQTGSISRLRRLLGEYKAPRIARVLEQELEDRAYERIVVLYYHRSVGEVLKRILIRFGVTGFDGAASQETRQEAIDSFQSGTGPRVFLAQQSAAGTGVNLQSASEIVLVEPDWSPDANRQAIKRVHRIGSKAPVRARMFGVAGSLDEKLIDVMATKARMQETVGV